MPCPHRHCNSTINAPLPTAHRPLHTAHCRGGDSTVRKGLCVIRAFQFASNFLLQVFCFFGTDQLAAAFPARNHLDDFPDQPPVPTSHQKTPIVRGLKPSPSPTYVSSCLLAIMVSLCESATRHLGIARHTTWPLLSESLKGVEKDPRPDYSVLYLTVPYCISSMMDDKRRNFVWSLEQPSPSAPTVRLARFATFLRSLWTFLHAQG